MKNFFFTFLLAIWLSVGFAAAQEGGRVVLDLKPELDAPLPDYSRTIPTYLEEVRRFDLKYPGALIEEDFIDDIAALHPDYSRDTATWKESFIRAGVRTLRIYNYAVDKFKDFLLANDVPLIVADEQYEMGTSVPYQESAEPRVTTDFKKVVAYSLSERDRAAAAAKIARDRGDVSDAARREELKKAILQLDWKKIFSYGLFDGKTFDDNRGIGDWAGQDNLKARLLASRTALGDKRTLEAALQIWVPDGWFLLTADYRQFPGLKTTFSHSFNLRSIEDIWPLPQRFDGIKNRGLTGYIGSNIIPLNVELQNNRVDMALRADIEAVVCGQNRCENVKLTPELRLRPGESEESRIAPFLWQTRTYAPQPGHSKLKIKNLVVETSANPADAQILRVELEAEDSPQNLDVFVETGNRREFASPLIRVDGKKIIARFKALDHKANLIGREFTIGARLRPEVSIRQKLAAQDASLFDLESGKITLGLIWLGFLGGLLLNLMPCVFPVLSLKLLSFTRFGGMNISAIRRSFAWHLLGILASFGVIIVLLVIFKLLGRSLGWGMQFQNVYFLTMMIFVVAAFLAQVWGLFSIPVPRMAEKLTGNAAYGGNLLDFLTGMFLVLLSTPCTAPFLGTALGFALAGSLSDIVIIVLAVGVGLASPYILFALFPALAYYIPAPGGWMRRLNWLMGTMLLLTMVWLLSILVSQTGSGIIFHFILFLGGFYLVLWLRRMLFDIIDQQEEEIYVLHRLKLLFNGIIAVLLTVLIAGALWDAGSAHSERRRSTEERTSSSMVSSEQIKAELRHGRIVLVRIGADWCLTCKYNELTVFGTPQIQEMLDDYQIVTFDVDWTGYNPEVLAFMEKFGRRGLPFYIIFSPRIPDGLVLPEIINDREFRELIDNVRY